MGLDLFMPSSTCKECGHQRSGFSANCTYNVAPMWYKIYPNDDGMVKIDGMTGQEAYQKLVHASKIMQENADEFKKLNPENGYGDFEDFLEFIHKLIWASLKYPESIWSACR